MCSHLAPRSLGTKPRATRVIILDTLELPKARGRNGLGKPKSRPADKRDLSPATMGLGLAGTLDPEGQAAFSCGRPVNCHPNRLSYSDPTLLR
jgi:hypothetical protein